MTQKELLQIIKKAARDERDTLDLDGKGLTALPPEIGQLQTLRALDLNNNQLTALPPEIGQLQNLKALDLAKNWLTALPPEIGQLQNLWQLVLRGNQLTSLPPEMGQLQDLRHVYLCRQKWANSKTSGTSAHHPAGRNRPTPKPPDAPPL